MLPVPPEGQGPGGCYPTKDFCCLESWSGALLSTQGSLLLLLHIFTLTSSPALSPSMDDRLAGDRGGAHEDIIGKTEPSTPSPSPMGSPYILVTSGGAVSRDSPGLADIRAYQQQASAHPPAPAGAPQEQGQGRSLKELLKRLEAEVTQLREQVPLEPGLCGVGGQACAVGGRKGSEGSAGFGGAKGP